ncbi:MAG: TonB-dependent receptor plug domain-containing protein, partial [Calditrichaeota bacterium]|nr:TonB-dependent receptor plug domain-containing protein [Calditrichota bacterium]
MVREKSILLSLLFFILVIATTSVSAKNFGHIEGYVKDIQTNDPLPYANIVVVGTSWGTTTDLNGKYVLKLPPGTYTIRCRFIGYKTEEATITVGNEERIKKNFKLKYGEVIKGKAIVVTAQAEGQVKAISQQLASKQIVNVVSSARIQELPDANAAESIARLPGVSIKRTGGEGNQVVIRGLAPKYNAVTIDGVRIASSNPNDRSADLSMISSNMLEGIEVYKTVTADQDADVIGGTVNFKMREARGERKGLGFRLLAQGGYTGLSNAYNKYDNYKIVPSIEGRFFNQKLGLFLQLNLEKRNLTSNEFGASYNHKSADHIYYVTNSIDLHFIPRFRKRTNAALMLDY